MNTHSNEEKTKVERGLGSLQRREESEKAILRAEIKAIREGHRTGGYCETELLREAEKGLWKILSQELEEAKKEFGYSPDPKFKHPKIRAIELELNGLSYKPELVVKG